MKKVIGTYSVKQLKDFYGKGWKAQVNKEKKSLNSGYSRFFNKGKVTIAQKGGKIYFYREIKKK